MLSMLIANNNRIAAVDLSNNKQLLQVQLGSNQLSAIDVTKQPNLSWLKVDNNAISTLDLKNNSYLYWLECGKNNIAELDLSNNKSLQRLEAEENQLTTLDLSKNLNLEGVLIQNVEINVNNEAWGRKLNISEMPGTAGANIEQARAKGWIVTAEFTSGIDSASAVEEGFTKYYFTISGHALGTVRPSVKGIYIVKEMNGTKVVSIQKIIIK